MHVRKLDIEMEIINTFVLFWGASWQTGALWGRGEARKFIQVTVECVGCVFLLEGLGSTKRCGEQVSMGTIYVKVQTFVMNC